MTIIATVEIPPGMNQDTIRQAFRSQGWDATIVRRTDRGHDKWSISFVPMTYRPPLERVCDCGLKHTPGECSRGCGQQL